MSRLYIVRHGNTFAPGEPPRRIGARTDLPLVESGRAQARALRGWFDAAGVRFDRAWSSPLARARQTAVALTDGPIETATWLDEIDHGPDEDRPEPDVIARVGLAAMAAWDRDGTVPPDWRVDASARVEGWRAILDRARGQAVAHLAVTSNGAARFALVATAELAADAALLPSRKLHTGAWGRLDHVRGRWRLAEWDYRPDDPGRLPARLPGG